MQDLNLRIEGDVNFSEERKKWTTKLDQETKLVLAEDEKIFMHQSLSTPCFNVISACYGIYLEDLHGNKIMDFHGNNVHQVGYRNEYVMNKVKAQMDVLPFSPRRYTNSISIEFSEKLLSYFPPQLNRLLYAPGGTSAIGMALKLARVVTGKQKIVSLHDSFHGASIDAIAAGGEEQFKKYMGEFPDTINISQPKTALGVRANQNSIAEANELEEVLRNDHSIGAFIAETVRNTDVIVSSKSYWKRIREICTQYGVLLILDEIPIAFGRTGAMFAFEHFGIVPDIVCLGKGMGAGIIPMAGIVTKEEYNIASDIALGHYTFEKNPLGAAAGLAMLEFLEDNKIIEKVISDQEFMNEQLLKLYHVHSAIGDVRGIGLLWAIELVVDRTTMEKNCDLAEKVMYYALKHGMNFKVSGGNVIQLSPALIINREELQRAVKIIDNALQELSQSLV